MSEEKKKNYRTEWSFSFDELGDRINEFVQSVTDRDGGEEIRTEQFSEALDGATSARVRLDIPVAETVVNGLVPADSLIEAEVTHIGEIKFAVTGDAHKVVNMSQEADAGDWMRNMFGWIGTKGRLRWNVGLTPSVPLDLDIHSGVGKTTLDLRKLELSALRVDGGAGEMQLTLPEGGERYTANLSGGVGEMRVLVPANASVELQISSGTGQVDLEIGEGAEVTARLRGGLGQTDVIVPDGAAVRLQAEMGMGDIKVPSHFVRTAGGDDHFVGRSGTWQTSGYENAERKIAIRFDGGVGGLRVR